MKNNPPVSKFDSKGESSEDWDWDNDNDANEGTWDEEDPDIEPATMSYKYDKGNQYRGVSNPATSGDDDWGNTKRRQIKPDNRVRNMILVISGFFIVFLLFSGRSSDSDSSSVEPGGGDGASEMNSVDKDAILNIGDRVHADDDDDKDEDDNAHAIDNNIEEVYDDTVFEDPGNLKDDDDEFDDGDFDDDDDAGGIDNDDDDDELDDGAFYEDDDDGGIDDDDEGNNDDLLDDDESNNNNVGASGAYDGDVFDDATTATTEENQLVNDSTADNSEGIDIPSEILSNSSHVVIADNSTNTGSIGGSDISIASTPTSSPIMATSYEGNLFKQTNETEILSEVGDEITERNVANSSSISKNENLPVMPATTINSTIGGNSTMNVTDIEGTLPTGALTNALGKSETDPTKISNASNSSRTPTTAPTPVLPNNGSSGVTNPLGENTEPLVSSIDTGMLNVTDAPIIVPVPGQDNTTTGFPTPSTSPPSSNPPTASSQEDTNTNFPTPPSDSPTAQTIPPVSN